MSALAPVSEVALVKRVDEREVVAEIKELAFGKVRGIFRAPLLPGGAPNPDYNTDGDYKRSECPMRTAAAVELVGALIRSNGTQEVNVTIRTIAIPQKRQFVDAEVVEVHRDEEK